MTTQPNTTAPTLIGASAGSGKTHRLTKVVTEAIDPTSPSPIDLRGLVAVTYTKKGAAELGSRIRQTLGASGAHHVAHRLPLAFVGTVHGVCLRLIKELAIDAGLSPLVDVLPGSEARVLRQALEWGLKGELRDRLDELAAAVQLRYDSKIDAADWFTPVHNIMTLVRSNRIDPEALAQMGRRSAARFLEVLGPPEADGDSLDQELLAALREAKDALSRTGDQTGLTKTATELVADSLEEAEAGCVEWNTWLKLQKLNPGVKSRQAVAPVQQVALRLYCHPRFQTELHELTLCMYEAAKQGLGAYEEWKQGRRIIDFVDMLDRALKLLEHPVVRAELSNRFDFVVVDEFQDTSPVQLALFVHFHALAGRSTWVGDPKQCIFEYAGADPELMAAVADWIRSSGGSTPQLEDNWRSRPQLVALCNSVFTAALRRHGYAPADVETTAARPEPLTLASLAPCSFWALDAKTKPTVAQAMANGVHRLLATPSVTPVQDRITGQVRELQPSDVAILVATNAEAAELAVALAQRGVRASIARTGLLATPEGKLVSAALDYLVEPTSELAVAEIEALTGFNGIDQNAWLEQRIVFRAKREEARAKGEAAPPWPLIDLVARLDALRPEIQALSPTETLDSVLARLNLAELCRRWPGARQRSANLDALRSLAAEYEERAARNREAATIAGLLRFFDEARRVVLVHDEEIASDDQHVSAGPDAVTIVTYHRAKGLEWPVVILASLNKEAKRSAFEASPETDRQRFDPADPLGGRWIRYWPRPFTKGHAPQLEQRIAASVEGVAVAQREERERARLLYVGFTRARDHLILTARIGKERYETEWLDALSDELGNPVINLPSASQLQQENQELALGTGAKQQRVRVRCWTLSAAEAPQVVGDSHRLWFANGPESQGELQPYWIAPSRAETEWPNLTLPLAGEVVQTGPRLAAGPDRSQARDVVGKAIHAFLAADLPELTLADRLVRAERLLSAADLLAVLAPGALLQAGDNLKEWVTRRWPTATWGREIPVAAVISTPEGSRRVAGTIDLLLEVPGGVVIIDHKSYPGPQATWGAKAAEFAPQFAAYAESLRLAGKTVLEQWVNFTIGGGAVRLSPPLGAEQVRP